MSESCASQCLEFGEVAPGPASQCGNAQQFEVRPGPAPELVCVQVSRNCTVFQPDFQLDRVQWPRLVAHHR